MFTSSIPRVLALPRRMSRVHLHPLGYQRHRSSWQSHVNEVVEDEDVSFVNVGPRSVGKLSHGPHVSCSMPLPMRWGVLVRLGYHSLRFRLRQAGPRSALGVGAAFRRLFHASELAIRCWVVQGICAICYRSRSVPLDRIFWKAGGSFEISGKYTLTSLSGFADADLSIPPGAATEGG